MACLGSGSGRSHIAIFNRQTPVGNLAFAACTLDYVLLLDCGCIPSYRYVEDHAALAEAGCFVQGRRATIREGAVGRYLEE